MIKTWAWIAGIGLTLAVGALAGNEHEAEANRQDAEALASRDFAARKVCQGRTFEWHGDVLTCFKELP